MKVLVNSNLFPIISVGMYESRLSPSNLFESSTIDNDYQEGYVNYDSEYYWEHWQNDLFEEEIQALACKFLDGKLKQDGIEIAIKTGEIYSPKYYNFSTDNIDLEVTFNKTKLLRYARDHKDYFNAYLKDNYSSYDGFSSHTANDFSEWLNDFKVNQVQSIGAILTYIFRDLIPENQESFYYLCEENLSYLGFTDTKPLEAEEQRIAEYIQANYESLDLEQLKASYEWEILTEDRVERIANELTAKIDGNTLDLFNN